MTSLIQLIQENHRSLNIDLFDGGQGKKIHDYCLNHLDHSKPHIMTDKYYCHSYIPIYDELFKEYKEKPINLLEIGVLHGGSANLWSKYFTNGNIYGMELNEMADWLVNHETIKVLQTDAYSTTALTAFNNIQYDIIIDDGPHTLESMIYFIENYIYKVNKDGLLIIEDIKSLQWVSELMQKIPKDVTYVYKVHDLRKKIGRFDDIMLILKIR